MKQGDSKGLAHRFSRSLNTLASAIVLLLMVSQIVVVALRYVFSLGWPWALDLLVYCFFMISILPLSLVLFRNISVRVDILYATWPDARRNLVDRVGLLLLLAPSMLYAAWTSINPMLRSWQLLEASPTFGGLPGYFLLKTFLTLAFALLAFWAVVIGLRPKIYQKEASDES